MIQEIICEYNDFDSLYGNKLTNPLNLGLFALYKMGATEDRLHEFVKGYIEHNLIPKLKDVKVHITLDNFNHYIGVDGYYSSFIYMKT